MSDQRPLKPDDFPIETDREKLRTQEGKTIASAASEKVADDVAKRLNEQAYQEECDRWSA